TPLRTSKVVFHCAKISSCSLSVPKSDRLQGNQKYGFLCRELKQITGAVAFKKGVLNSYLWGEYEN
ncbi:MAG: hypothetical protein WEC12_02315, partial [Balneolaceae bacterium]